MANNKKSVFTRIKNSFFTGSKIQDTDPAQYKKRMVLRSLILHLHPQTIDERAGKFNRTFGLGGMAALLICIQFFTGLLLRFYYEPSPARAYNSIIAMQQNTAAGLLLRNVHHWSAELLIIITVLHLARVFFSGGFRNNREFNWILGITLLLVVLFSNFTGYLLPWDQLSYWAVTVSAGMLDYIPLAGSALKEALIGGEEIGSAALIIFYNLHTGILPIFIILLMSFHFWRVRKAGGVALPKSGAEIKQVDVIPNLAVKEFTAALILIAVLLIFSMIFDAGLSGKANPTVSPNPAKAPWYFLGIQELLIHFHPVFALFVIPTGLLLFALVLPYFNYSGESIGNWFYSDRGKKLAIRWTIISGLATALLILFDELAPDFGGFSPLITGGLIPTLIIVAILIVVFRTVSAKAENAVSEAVQTIFVILITSLIVLTLTGIFFRGEGMALTFPF